MSRRPAPPSAIEGFAERAQAANRGARRLFGSAPAATPDASPAAEPALADAPVPPDAPAAEEQAAAEQAAVPVRRRQSRAKRVAAPARSASTSPGERKLEALFLVPRASLLLLRHEADRRFAAGEPRRDQRFSAIVGGLIDRARESGFALSVPVGEEEGAGERLPLRLSESQHAWVHSQYASLYDLGARGRALTRSSVIRALLEQYLAN